MIASQVQRIDHGWVVIWIEAFLTERPVDPFSSVKGNHDHVSLPCHQKRLTDTHHDRMLADPHQELEGRLNAARAHADGAVRRITLNFYNTPQKGVPRSTEIGSDDPRRPRRLTVHPRHLRRAASPAVALSCSHPLSEPAGPAACLHVSPDDKRHDDKSKRYVAPRGPRYENHGADRDQAWGHQARIYEHALRCRPTAAIGQRAYAACFPMIQRANTPIRPWRVIHPRQLLALATSGSTAHGRRRPVTSRTHASRRNSFPQE